MTHFFEQPPMTVVASTKANKRSRMSILKTALKCAILTPTAETEEELKKIEEMGVSFMSEAIMAYRHVAASPEFREMERVRSKARHDEAQAIHNAERKLNEHWQGVVAEKDAENADLRAQLEELRKQMDNRN